MARWTRGAALLSILTSTGCTLLVSLDGLAGGDATDSGTSSTEGGIDGGVDAPDTTAPDPSIDGGADAAGAFSDDFNRPDSPTIGNGWIEKNPNAFALSGDQVVRNVIDSLAYPDNLVYRPAAEDLLDVQASVEFTVASSASPGYPQVWGRIQGATAMQSGAADAYSFYVNGSPNSCVIARQRGSTNTTLRSISLATTISVANRYRLTLRITGTSPVLLAGVVEMSSPAGSTWTVIGQGTFSDTDATRVMSPGAVGLSANTGESSGQYRYDNFKRTPF